MNIKIQAFVIEMQTKAKKKSTESKKFHLHYKKEGQGTQHLLLVFSNSNASVTAKRILNKSEGGGRRKTAKGI